MDTAESLKLIKRCQDELGAMDVRLSEQLHWRQGEVVSGRTYELWVTRTAHHTIILRGLSYDELNMSVGAEARRLDQLSGDGA